MMPRIYYRGAFGCIIMFDLTNRVSFEEAKVWKAGIEKKVFLPNSEPIPYILVANKVCLIPCILVCLIPCVLVANKACPIPCVLVANKACPIPCVLVANKACPVPCVLVANKVCPIQATCTYYSKEMYLTSIILIIGK